MRRLLSGGLLSAVRGLLGAVAAVVASYVAYQQAVDTGTATGYVVAAIIIGAGAAILMVGLDMYAGRLSERSRRDAGEVAGWVIQPLYSLLRATAQRKDNPEWSTVNASLYAVRRTPVLGHHLRWGRNRQADLAIHTNIALGKPRLPANASVLQACISGNSAQNDTADEFERAVVAEALFRNGKPVAILALDVPSSQYAWLMDTTPVAIAGPALSLNQILSKGGVQITGPGGTIWV